MSVDLPVPGGPEMPSRRQRDASRCGRTSESSSSAASRLAGCVDSTSVIALLSARRSPATSAVASVLLAPHVARMGTRRIALAGACLFPGGMLFAALAVHANHWPMYAFSTTVVSGLGFWCVYPQMPPFLATKWFADGRRRGLALSLYFAAFGSGLFFATPFLEAVLAACRLPPTRLGGLELLGTDALSTGARIGERIAQLDGAAAVPCVAATARDLSARASSSSTARAAQRRPSPPSQAPTSGCWRSRRSPSACRSRRRRTHFRLPRAAQADALLLRAAARVAAGAVLRAAAGWIWPPRSARRSCGCWRAARSACRWRGCPSSRSAS
mmetsp:Transcript_37651/g.122016  ORF Transcript_37651/g.122016 Transcript_37651/m.122016 type:complete len:328 (+) Transcript_37651:69-1052(+)